ncbi:MAG: hypothetical protein M3O71_03340 [Bacteroidota bacterium]|nr:hypothetical protein [Bacteroidota bacterium]
MTADEKVKDKFLTTGVTKNWISVKPKAKYGNVFKSTIGFEDSKQLSLVKPATVTTLPIGGQRAIAYCLTYNVGSHSNLHLPVLMPCLGVTSKHNNEVVSFKQFNRRDKPIAGVTYNVNQQQLNEISTQQNDISIRHYGLTGEGKKQEAAKAKHEMLNLWERAVPLL